MNKRFFGGAMKRHHVINGSLAAIIAAIVSLTTWFVVIPGLNQSNAATAGTYACFKSSTGHVYLRSTCKTGEKRILINGTGLQGSRGYSNFELAQQNGYTGTVTDWLKTLVGPAGSSGSGSTGATGATGPAGPAGPAGLKGDAGTPGAGFEPVYGAFYDTNAHYNTVNDLPSSSWGGTATTSVNVPKLFKLNSTYSNGSPYVNGVSIVDGTKISVTKSGIYNVQFSSVFDKKTTGDDTVDIWIRRDGIDIPNSGTSMVVTTSATQGGANVAAWNFFVYIEAGAGHYAELVWASSEGSIRMQGVPAITSPYSRPAIPSTILTVTQVG